MIGSHIITSRRLPLPYSSQCALAPDTKRPYYKDVKQTLQECLFKSRLKEVWKHIGENWTLLRTKPNNTLGWSVTSGLLGSIAQISLSAPDRQSWITIIYLAACLQQQAYWLLTPVTVYQVEQFCLTPKTSESRHLFAECQKKPSESFKERETL